jgi:hypothetical protein
MPWRVHHKIYKLLNYHIYLNKNVVLSQQPYHGRTIQLLSTELGGRGQPQALRGRKHAGGMDCYVATNEKFVITVLQTMTFDTTGLQT